MNELREILDAWRQDSVENRSAVLATVVHVKGSAYRRPGARMLLLADGRRIGSISGGCLEGDVSRKAWWLTEEGNPAVRVYDTTSEDDAVWEFGLGCNGIVHVLLERISRGRNQDLLAFLEQCLASGEPAVIAALVRSADETGLPVASRLFVAQDGTYAGTLVGTTLEKVLRGHATAAIREQQSRFIHLNGHEVFVEFIAPPQPLVIFGAGHDAIPLVAIAKQMGWHVTVADGRPAYARPDRFPGADRVVLLDPRNPLAGLRIPSSSAVVLMTHNYPQDARLLPGVLSFSPRYVGILGPRHRTERLLKELGASLGNADLHAPVGLDIGGDNPQTIALSVAAEIQAVLSGRSGGPLKFRTAALHAPANELGVPLIPLHPANDFAGCSL